MRLAPRKGRSIRYYRGQEIEDLMDQALESSGLMPTLEAPVTRLEHFIERHLKVRLDEWADLGPEVLGQTDFSVRPIKISINRLLTDEAEGPGCRPGLKGRRRATLGHEAAHVILHEDLYPYQPAGRGTLFEGPPAEEERPLQVCKARDIFDEPGRPPSDWREVQANKGMAALLMPRQVFCEAARERIVRSGWDGRDLSPGSHGAERLKVELARRFEVSKQACEIRLRTLKIVDENRQPWLPFS